VLVCFPETIKRAVLLCVIRKR